MRPYKGVSIQLTAIRRSVLLHVMPVTPNSADKACLPGWEPRLKQEQNVVVPGSQTCTLYMFTKFKFLCMSESELKCQLSSKCHDIMLDLFVRQYHSMKSLWPKYPGINSTWAEYSNTVPSIQERYWTKSRVIKNLKMFAFTFSSSVISFSISIFRVEPARTDEQRPFLSFIVYNMKENKP